MKRFQVALAAVLALSLTGCQAYVPSRQPVAVKPDTATMAPVTFSLTGLTPRITRPSFGVQAVPTYAFTKARVEITGPGIVDPIEIEDVPITDGVGTFSEMIPMGPNRIFRAFAVDADGADVAEVVVGAVQTINPGENHVNLTWQGLPVAQAYLKLTTLNSPHASSFQVNLVQNYVTTRLGTMPHPSLFNGYVLGAYIAANNAVPGGIIPNLTRSTGKVFLQVKGLSAGQSYDAWLEDPASELKSGINTDALQEFPSVLAVTLSDIENPPALNWTMHVVINNALGQPEKRIKLENVAIAIAGTKEIVVELAGPTNGNIDFTNGDGNLPPDPTAVPELDPTLYDVTIS